jgi:hypothetical protein
MDLVLIMVFEIVGVSEKRYTAFINNEHFVTDLFNLFESVRAPDARPAMVSTYIFSDQ